MTRTRWKIMIGGLGLGLGGLAAVAGVPAANGVSCAGSPTHTVARVGDPAPAPKAADLKPAGPSIPALPTIPPIGVPELPSAPAALPVPAAPEPIPVFSAPLPPVLPAIPQGIPPLPVSPTPIDLAMPLPAPAPVTSPEGVQFRVTAAPGTSVVRFDPQVLPLPVTPVPEKPAFAPIPTPSGIPVRPTQTFVVQADPVSPPKAVVPTPERAKPIDADLGDRIPPASVVPTPADAPKLAERKLKVILSMGDERPRFEVRDGDEIYLKVVCDRVEVKSPGEGGASVSTMRASGKVTFVTPGGEGTCDELAVLPGTGQVIVTGKVSFTYNWGKVETTVTGEKMNFRLGSNTVTPSAAATGVTGLPASYTRTR